MVTVNSDCLATYAHVSSHYWNSETQTGGDANSIVVHFVADTG
jgi:hypothetical protein